MSAHTQTTRKNEELMAAGVTLEDPATAYIDRDVQVGADTIIHPGVYLEGTTRIGVGCEIHSRRAHRRLGGWATASTIQNYCVIVASHVGERRRGRAVRAPAAGADVGEGARVGNFVELKKTTLGAGSKANAPGVPRRRDDRRERQHRRRHDHVQLRRRAASTRPSSRTARSSAATRSSSRRSRIGKGAYVGSGHRRSREDVPPARSASARGKQTEQVEGWVGEEEEAVIASRDSANRSRGNHHVRHHRLHRRRRTSCRSSSTGCGGWSTAATTRPASRSCATAPSSCGAAPASSSQLEEAIAANPLDGRLRHRPHPMGHPRPADRGERPSAPRLHRPDRRRAQRHHRELPRSEAASSRRQGHTLRHRDRHRNRRAPRRTREPGRRPRERRAAGAAADARAVRAGADLGRRPGEDRRGPQRPADRRRPRRAASSSWRRTSRPSSRTRATWSSSATRRWPSITRGGRRRSPTSPAGRVEGDAAHLVGSGHGGEGRLQALHAQGDLRAADGGARDHPRPRLAGHRQGLPRGDDISTRRCSRRSSASSILACGTSWHAALVGKFLIEALARVPVDVDYGSEYRYRDPIVDAEHAGDRHHPVRRNGRHAGGAARGEEEGRPQHRDLQRRRQHGDAGNRRHGLHARRARDRGGLHQGLHVAAGRAAPARHLPRPDSRDAVTGRGPAARSRRSRSCPLQIEQALKCEPVDRGDRQAVLPAERFPLPRARHQLPDRPRGRAEAEGDLVHPRGGLSRRRDEARADRAHRRAACPS